MIINFALKQAFSRPNDAYQFGRYTIGRNGYKITGRVATAYLVNKGLQATLGPIGGRVVSSVLTGLAGFGSAALKVENGYVQIEEVINAVITGD